MDIAAAQRDISNAYLGGAPAVLVSGIVWLIAGSVGRAQSLETAFAVLFFGGMLIVPVSLLIARVSGAGKVAADNPLQRLGLEGTFVLFAGIFMAYVLLRVAPELAFPALALAIGARYFAFRTIYGEPVYWALGGLLAIIGALEMLRLNPIPISFLLIVGAAECVFSAVLLWRWKRRYPRATN